MTDCRSILQSFQSPGGEQIFGSIRQELSLLKNKTAVILQWISSHCGVEGNEEADRLSRIGSKLEKCARSMSYSKTKAILRNNFRAEWRHRLDIGIEEDSIHQVGQSSSSYSLWTENWTLSTPLPPPQTENFPFRHMSVRHRSSSPQLHPAVLPYLRCFEAPDKAQSGGCAQEVLGPG